MKLKEFLHGKHGPSTHDVFARQMGISRKTLYLIMKYGTNKKYFHLAIEKLTKNKVMAKDLKPTPPPTP